jgi:hypothetical protein
MRMLFAVSAGVALLTAAGAGWAGPKDKGPKDLGEDIGSKEKEPASFNKTFQWEEKVVGPKDKGVDHGRIAAMQEQGRREEAAKRREPPKKVQRTEGINGPASSVIPTQDIEKPAPAGSVRSPIRKASYTQPKPHDAIDDVLAENSASDDGSHHAGLANVIGGSSKSHRSAKHVKHGRRRHR